MARFRIPYGRPIALGIAAFALSIGGVIGREVEPLDSIDPEAKSDSTKQTSLSDWFSKGHFSGLWRTQAMATLHQAPLSDNWASGTAFRLHYATADFRGWYVSVIGQFGYALASSDLTGVDELTGQRARFELHMFDIQDPTNRKDFDRLENLTLNKRFKHGELVMGRYSFESPFVNGQDTRLKANAFSGVTGNMRIGARHQHTFTGALMHGISPRGTIKWFGLGESLGLLDNGLRPDGEPAAYKDHLHTPGMAILGWNHKSRAYEAEAWHYHADGLFMHTYARFTKDLSKDKGLNIGIEAVYQQKHRNGGSEAYEHRYYFNEAPAFLLGNRIRKENPRFGIETASLISIGDGTYLFPREWGRERFFTSVPRARVEGLGRFTEVSLQVDTRLRENIKVLLTLAYLDVADSDNTLWNKYSLVDHYLVNGEMQLDGNRFMKNTSFRFIAAAHYPSSGGFSPDDLYYKAEFVHFSLQMDLHF